MCIHIYVCANATTSSISAHALCFIHTYHKCISNFFSFFTRLYNYNVQTTKTNTRATRIRNEGETTFICHILSGASLSLICCKFINDINPLFHNLLIIQFTTLIRASYIQINRKKDTTSKKNRVNRGRLAHSIICISCLLECS